MDSRDPLNPYSQSPCPSFVGFLNSQTFPYESYGSPLHFGASDIPAFSSQPPHAPVAPENPPVAPENPPVASRERRNWSPADDEVLISGWLNTSKDAVVGVDKKSGTFWKRVGEFYASSSHAQASGESREHLHCKQRWHKINDYTNKFCAAYAAAERQMSSGQNDNDLLKLAKDIYFADHKTKFTLDHAWCLLRYEQKWTSINTPKRSGNSKRKETGSEASSSTVGDPEVRLEGIKAAKAKRKNSAPVRSVSECQTVWEMKNESLFMQEKILKLAILDTLLAKNQLTEAEEGVKNMLLVLYFKD